jgi:hypothetical protein
MTATAWTWTLKVQSRTPAGAVLHTYAPAEYPASVRVHYAPEQLDRRLWRGKDSPVQQGARGVASITLQSFEGRLTGASGYSCLEEVLADYLDGAKLFVAMNGTDYKEVTVTSWPEPEPRDEKHIGMTAEIEFTTAERFKAYPTWDGGSW